MSDKPSKATKSRHSFVSKQRKPISTQKSMDESVAEDVPAKEAHVNAEEADMQKALEESMKSMYDVPQGPLPPVAHDLLNLQNPKRKSPADQYIFQRRTSTPIRSSGHDESSSLYVELGLSDSKEESQEVVPRADAGGQCEGQAGPDPGQARPDPSNTGADEQPMPSHVVHAGSDHEHMDLDVADVSPRPSTEQMNKGFTATAYPKAMQAPLRNRFTDLPELDMKEIFHQHMWEFDSYKSHKDHMQLYEALEKSMNHDHSEELTKDLAKAGKKKKKRPSGASRAPGASGSSQVPTPPPLPPSTNQEKCHKLLTNSVDNSKLRHNVSKPLPLGGPPGQVTIQSDFFFNKDLEYLRYDSKGSKPAMSISKIKAAYYPDVGLEQMVPDQIWIEKECKYDIVAMYGISHWWFQRQRFYIDRHTSEGDHSAVRKHMRILSVVRIKVFSMYGYDYMKEIVLHRADLNEHVIAERDFKYQYLSDFKDLYLLNLQDYTVIDSPRAVTFRDRYGVQMMMRFNEIHKFSDGTLQQIDEALYYRVKEFKINKMNPCLNMRFWTKKDVDRSKAFMFAIQKWLKTRMIFCNLESFVGGRVRDGDYRHLKRTE
nr:hypothetical protein [Tanacetum cinerariifolium]